MIKRDKYLNEIIDREKNGMIKIITGIRRCGKSYLIKKMNLTLHSFLKEVQV